MKLQTSFIDHSAILGLWPHHAIACRDMHQQLDLYSHLRMSLGAALAPPASRILPLGGGLLAIVRRVEEPRP